jgi:serine/threonine-protein kinase
MEDLSGRQFGPFRIEKPLSEGGMSTVYKAFQPGVERYVALKVMPRHLADDPQFAARFQQEARVVAQLQHPHILPIYDFGQAEGYTYLAMPLMETGTLIDLMKGQPLSLNEIKRIIGQIGDALDYAHTQGLVHRDVKPSNVLIDKRGNCLLTDFGIVKLLQNKTATITTGGVTGTPAYMSPEQGMGRQLDGRSDQYSLGVILYELATGRPPYDADTPMAVVIKHINESLPPPRSVNPAISEGVEKVITRALSKNPEERFLTITDMVYALEKAITDEQAANSAPTQKMAPTAPRLRWPVLAGLGLAGFVALMGAWTMFSGSLWASTPISPTSTATLTVPAPTTTTVPPSPSATAQAQPTATVAISPTVSAAITPSTGLTQISERDGMVQVFVPAGPFTMGSTTEDQNALAFERPQREVTVDDYWIDQTEITNAQYALCVAAGRCRAPISARSATRLDYATNPDYQNYPVIYVGWSDARNYCEWAGRRLLSEAEWEKAARGTDARIFPWGNTQPNQTRANFNNLRADTTAVGSYPESASPAGALDMAGNVAEWVNDWYLGAYYRTAPLLNPLGPDTGTARVVRGGGWSSDLRNIRTANRYNYGPTGRENFIGFRCGQ